MTSHPPLYRFRPFDSLRVALVRAARELAWVAPPAKTKRAKGTSKPKKPLAVTLPPGLSDSMRAEVMRALESIDKKGKKR